MLIWIIYLLGFVLAAAGILLLLRLNAARVADDLTDALRTKQLLRRRNVRAKTGKLPARERFLLFLESARDALASGNRNGKTVFAAVCAAAVGLAAAFGIAGVGLGNVFLSPVLAAFGFALPFLWLRRSMNAYRMREAEELETALSVLSSSYLRTGDILAAVRENLPGLRPPVKDAFGRFLFECSSVDADMQKAILHLRSSFPHPVFREWCDCLAACDRDRTMGDLLLPVVAKMADERLINSEMKTVTDAAKREYCVMLGLLFGNIPLLYFLNRDWLDILLYSVPGKIVLSVCCLTAFVTFLLLGKITSPVRYTGTEGTFSGAADAQEKIPGKESNNKRSAPVKSGTTVFGKTDPHPSGERRDPA